MKIPAYPKYKAIGVEWLGDVPKGWSFERLRFSVISNPVKSEVLNWNDDTLISFIPMEAVGEYGGIELSKEKAIGDVYGGYTYFANGDIVIAKITPCFENGKGAIACNLTSGVAFGTTEFHVLRPLKGISQKWLFYLTMSYAFRNVGASEMLGAGGQKRVPETYIKDFRTGIPTPAEQQKIANFLDWKTGQIDALITKKKLLIEKLKEKRIALITHAVTKGLNPNAKMKDSGIPWLGEVPEHWEVRRLRFSIKSNPVKSEISHLKSDFLVSFIPMKAVGEQGEMSLNQERQLDEVYSGYTYFANGDIVVAKITPCFENGKGAIAEHLKNGFAFGTTEFHVIRALEHMCKRWLFYLSISDAFRSIGASEMLGAGGQKRIPENFIKDFRIGIPSLTEQQEISDFLDRKNNQTDTLITKNQQLIKKLTEYRTALITAATTGKIDVRGIEIPQGISQ